MAELSPEQKEKNLVERVDFRIITASNDEAKLQPLLTTYLAPLILKAGSEHESVRKLVLESCQRIRRFTEAPSSVVLPVAALLAQFKSADKTMIKTLDMMFLLPGVTRLDPPEQRELIPVAFRGIAKETGANLRLLVQFIIKMLPALQLPQRGSQDDEKLRETLGLSDPEDAALVVDCFGKLILHRRTGPSPGLSSSDDKFLRMEWDSPGNPNLSETKMKLMSLFASGAFTDEKRLLPAVCAAGSADGRLSSMGEDILKRASTVDLEDPFIVGQLFWAHAHFAPRERIKILGLLSRSAEATKRHAEIKRVIARNLAAANPPPFDGEYDPATSYARIEATTGLELNRLHRALFEFINWVARIGPTTTLCIGGNFALGEELLDIMHDFIKSQGWPAPEPTTAPDQLALRVRAYETIGELAKTTRPPREKGEALFEFLFESLSYDTADVGPAVEGALAGMERLFKALAADADSDSDSKQGTDEDDVLHRVLLTAMTTPADTPGLVRSPRGAAVKCANRFLPYSDYKARFIDILAAAGRPGERSDVVEEGLRGLDPWTYLANYQGHHGGSSSSGGDGAGGIPIWPSFLPSWPDLVYTFFDHLERQPLRDAALANNQNVKCSLAVKYCTQILFLKVLGKRFSVGPGWEARLETKVRTDYKARALIRAELPHVAEEFAAKQLLQAAFAGMLQSGGGGSSGSTPRGTVQDAVDCARCFVDIASVTTDEELVFSELATRHARSLMPVMGSNSPKLRSLAASAFGILGSQAKVMPDIRRTWVVELGQKTSTWKTAVGSDANASMGAFLGLAHLVSRTLYVADRSGAGLSQWGGAPLTDDNGLGDDLCFLPPPSEVASAPASAQNAIFEAAAQFWTAGALCFPGKAEAERRANVTAWTDVLFAQAKKGNERAIAALGRLALALRGAVFQDGVTPDGPDGEAVTAIVDKLYELHEIKQAEVHFAVGEALTAAVACWDSYSVLMTLDVEIPRARPPYHPLPATMTPRVPARLRAVLTKLLADCKSTKPSLLKASGIWLFVMVQYISEMPEVQSRLRGIQAAFMRLLSARDELVQETASRGLALVYEKGSEELRGQLVKDLVSAFTGSGPQIKVDQDTELFEAGALPTGEGKSITSYRDIVSLANEVGDQSLVYKFMALATNAATWSTRSAFGRFGLSSILSSSEVDPKLYPKLYRYRFDPNPNVKKSMDDIWKALVRDSAAVIDTHFDAILTDLLKSILGKEWRVREASCAAIADLIGGQKFHKYHLYYEQIWAVALRVLDDVKGSVREAALGLCIHLSNTLVRQLEESGGSSSTGTSGAMMARALPFLLSEKGIESGVDEVKGMATITVIKICKHGGAALRPFMKEIVQRLLGLLSTVEPDQINYLYQRVGEDSREKIDRARSQAVSSSPISEAIDNALRTGLDASNIEHVLGGVVSTIMTAVGMPTKIGCSRVLSTLATRHGADFAPSAARMLIIMEHQVLDRNDEVSQAYARASAFMMRVAPQNARLAYADSLEKLYFKAEDEHRRQKVADAVLALSKTSPDHFASVENKLLPLAYVASHDPDSYVRQCLAAVWAEHAGSARSAVRFMPEIVALIGTALDAPQWALKHAGALAAGAMVEALVATAELSGVSGGQVELAKLKAVWPVFDRALALKTFEGKEKLLEEALPGFVEKGRLLWTADATMAAQLRKIAVREAKRNNDEYRVHALPCLWKVARARDDIDMLDDTVAVATPHLEVLRDEDRMEVDEDITTKGSGGKKDREALIARTAANALEAVARGYSRPALKTDPGAALARILKVLRPYLESAKFDRVRRDVWYKCVSDILNETATTKAGSSGATTGNDELARAYLASLDLDKADVGTEEQRTARARAVVALAKALKKGIFGATGAVDGARGAAKAGLEKAMDAERSMDVRKILRDGLAELA